MNISVHEAEKLSSEAIGRFVEASGEIRFESQNREQVFAVCNFSQSDTIISKP